MDYKQLGIRLREERKRLGLTQEKIAEFINISESYMGQIERGERNLTLETLVRLANQLGVTVDYLLRDSVNIENDSYLKQLSQLLHDRPAKQKQMAVDVIKIMFSHLEGDE